MGILLGKPRDDSVGGRGRGLGLEIGDAGALEPGVRGKRAGGIPPYPDAEFDVPTITPEEMIQHGGALEAGVPPRAGERIQPAVHPGGEFSILVWSRGSVPFPRPRPLPAKPAAQSGE
jgi:hypothetical protein